MPRPANNTKAEIYVSIKLTEELTDRLRFFQKFYQLKYSKEALRMIIVQATNTLGYKKPSPPRKPPRRPQLPPIPLPEPRMPSLPMPTAIRTDKDGMPIPDDDDSNG